LGAVLWPTPRASNFQQEDAQSWLERNQELAENRPKGASGMTLDVAVQLWPTPRSADSLIHGTIDAARNRALTPGRRWKAHLEEAVGLMPTPTANRWSGLQSHGQNALLGQLNPTWVEWLMGYPAGWTDSAD